MKFKELKIKSDKELGAMLVAAKENLQVLKFKVAAKQMKDVREIRVAKLQIAQVLTILKQRKNQTGNKEK